MKLKAKCSKCGDVMISETSGHFSVCKCAKSYIDQDTLDGEDNNYYRARGYAINIKWE